MPDISVSAYDPIQSLSQLSSDFDKAAAKIACATLPPPINEYPNDTADLCREIVAMIQAKDDFEANTKPVGVLDRLTRNTLDMIG